MTQRKWSPRYLYCLVAGLGDTVTGLLLLFAPATTLTFMQISITPIEPEYLQFIGAFVGGVGLSYLYPFLYSRAARRDATLAVVLEVTALIRLAVAAFVGWAIARGLLSPGWASVLATDLALATLQIAMVKGGAFSADSSADWSAG